MYRLKRWFGFFKFKFIRFFNRYYDSFHDDIKEIMLVLENCECITFSRKHIGQFLLDDIHTTIAREGANYIGKSVQAGKFALEVKNDANISKTSTDKLPFNRIVSYGDICQVNIVYKTGKEDSYYIDYEEDSQLPYGGENIYQKSRINEHGDLELVIGKDMFLDDCFEKQSKEGRDITWEYYE